MLIFSNVVSTVAPKIIAERNKEQVKNEIFEGFMCCAFTVYMLSTDGT